MAMMTTRGVEKRASICTMIGFESTVNRTVIGTTMAAESASLANAGDRLLDVKLPVKSFTGVGGIQLKVHGHGDRCQIVLLVTKGLDGKLCGDDVVGTTRTLADLLTKGMHMVVVSKSILASGKFKWFAGSGPLGLLRSSGWALCARHVHTSLISESRF